MDLISSYSSLIEFFAALYTTMAIENDFFREIWNPQDKNAITTLLQEQDQADDKGNHFDIISKCINDLHQTISMMTNRRGGFMLGLCVLLLILCGQYFKFSDFSISCMLVLSCIFMLLNNYLFRKWKGVVFFIFMLPIILYIGDYLEKSTNLIQNTAICWLISHLGLLLIITIISPIIYHLLINWMYHGVYKAYLKELLSNAIDDYNSACNDLEAHRDKYEDIDMSQVEEELKRRLIKICSPSLLKLIFSFSAIKIKRLVSTIKIVIKTLIEKLLSLLKSERKKMGVRQYIRK